MRSMGGREIGGVGLGNGDGAKFMGFWVLGLDGL